MSEPEGTVYANGAVRVNKPCPECGMSYLLLLNGVLYCNHADCNYSVENKEGEES